jgi:hypothetical protein
LPAVCQELSRPLESSPDVRLTDSCNTVHDATSQVIVIGAPEAVRDEIVAKVGDPSADPALLRALWLPRLARKILESEVLVDYVDRFQDIAQIAASVKAALAARGVRDAIPNGPGGCFAALPPPPLVNVTEFFHPTLNHYQLAVGDTERGTLTSTGWIATGDTFRALGQASCYGGVNVFRFTRALGKRRGSRFLTTDTAECGLVRKSSAVWRPLDVPFYATVPDGGRCQTVDGALAVFRAYNGRETFNDMNHRYTTSFATYNAMIAQGWKGEGIAFCAMGQ